MANQIVVSYHWCSGESGDGEGHIVVMIRFQFLFSLQ